ncbi:MAG: hypothetical protein R3F62_28565 [Planctomycetota bacterium]
MSAARKDLAQRGLGPGPSLAIGHVGVELLLDGQLRAAPRGAGRLPRGPRPGRGPG